MAKGKTSETSKIRVIMVEAEISDGEIGQITRAIQIALKTSSPVTTQRLLRDLWNGVSQPEAVFQEDRYGDLTIDQAAKGMAALNLNRKLNTQYMNACILPIPACLPS